MRRLFALGSLLLTARSFAAPAVIPFDRAYMVSSLGSTTPITQFTLDGPAPVLYLDLPAAWGQYSYGASNWFAGTSQSASLSHSSPGIFTSDGEYWLAPSESAWDGVKALGDWRVNASYAWWDLVIIYGGGAPVTNARGSTTVNFSVVADSLGGASSAANFGSIDGIDLTGDLGESPMSRQDGTLGPATLPGSALVPEPASLMLLLPVFVMRRFRS